METGMPEHDWKQHFPTYQFYHRDIVLKEYESAAKTLEAAERLFVNATNITVVVTAALGSLAVGSLDKLIGSFSGLLSPQLIGIALVIMVVVFSITTVKYFADRHKAILFASRKVVVLRRMLGLSFGSLQLVLPNWRTEGADEPFALRLFPGWSASIAYPYWIVATFSSAILLLLQDPLSHADFLELHAKLVPAADEKWQTIPWRTDLLKARDDAAAAKKPVFLWSMNGHPLGCT